MRKSIVLFALLALAACGDDKGPTNPDPDPAITLSEDSIFLTPGQSFQVTATVTNSTAAALFESRNEAIATVSANGTIAGVTSGRTVIVSTLTGNASVRDSVIVNVDNEQTGVLRIPLLGTGLVPERYTAEIAVAEPFAYTTTWSTRMVVGNAVKIWNVTGNTPILVDSLILSGAGTVSDVQISSDGSLLVASTELALNPLNNGIAIYDRSNAAKPVLIRRFTTQTLGQGVHTVKLGHVNGKHYAFASVNPRGDPAKLAIIDITDPANPVEVFVQIMGQPYVHDVFIRDGVLFAALWDTGLRIFDIGGAGRGGSPSSPVAMGTVKTLNCSTCGDGTASVHNVWWYHDPGGSKQYAFVGEEGPGNTGAFNRAAGAVHVIDVSDFNAPREVAVYEPDSTTTWSGRSAGAHNFVVDEQSGVLYAAFYTGGVRALDVRGDLGTCTAAQKTADGRCDLLKMGREIGIGLSDAGVTRFIWGVALQGNNLYASDMPNGIHKLNISALKR